MCKYHPKFRRIRFIENSSKTNKKQERRGKSKARTAKEAKAK